MRSWASVQWQPADEWDGGFGWVAVERMQRTSHALRLDGGVWLIDPVDAEGVEEHVRALGEPAGVLQLLDRHNRDCVAWAERLGVPLHRAWESSPFPVLPVRASRLWREVALWDEESRTLVCADALGTVDYFRTGRERIGWHPLVRPLPPRSFAGIEPERILVGHGAGVFDGAAGALDDLRRHGRRRTPAAWLSAARAVWAASRSPAPGR